MNCLNFKRLDNIGQMSKVLGKVWRKCRRFILLILELFKNYRSSTGLSKYLSLFDSHQKDSLAQSGIFA